MSRGLDSTRRVLERLIRRRGNLEQGVRGHPRTGEEGVAVLTVLLTVTLLLILGGALLLTARLSLERSIVTTDSSRALHVAEAGMQTSAQAIVDSGFSAGETGTISGDMGGDGEYTVDWTAHTALAWFTMTATGYYPTQTNANGVRRITSETFSLNPWDFQYAGGMTGATVNGNVWVEGPFYVNDELEMSGTAGVHEGPLIIKDTQGPGGGDLILDSSSADIGSSGHPVPLFLDGTVTKNQYGSYYANPVYNWAPELEFPELTADDLKYYRWDKDPTDWNDDLERPCALWDQDSQDDNDTALTFSKSSQPSSSDGNMQELSGEEGRVSWSFSGNDLTITFDNTGDVEPILYIDGDLTMEGGSGQLTIRYEGIGTIVAAGNIAIYGDLVPVGSDLSSDPVSLNGFPETNRIGFVTPNSLHYEGNSSEWMGGAIYTGDTASFGKQGNFKGSAVTRLLDLGNQVPHLYTEPGFATKLPPRMPGADARITSIIGWSELSPP